MSQAASATTSEPRSDVKSMGFFERHLTLWVLLCMAVGVGLGRVAPSAIDSLRRFELAAETGVNGPIAALIWLMITPMMMKIDFSSVVRAAQRPGGLLITLFVNWLVKPFGMFALGWLFFHGLFSAFIDEELARQYTAGVVILAAAPCTAMVFVWSYLTDGDPGYTLVQVAVNDLLMLVLFAPIVALLVGATGLAIPVGVLIASVIAFIVVPLTAGVVVRAALLRLRGERWFEETFLPACQPIAVVALLATLVLIFAFQADNIVGRPAHVALIAVPILVQVYFNASLTYFLMQRFGVPYEIAAPGALIGASNFFELAVATAAALYGPDSGAALATVVGVLVEVPVMLSVCSACRATRNWFPTAV